MSNIFLFLVVGLFFAWIMRSYRRYESTYYKAKQFKNITITDESIAQSELGLFVALAAKVAKADGQVHELEAELIFNLLEDISKAFEDQPKAHTILKRIFNREKEIESNIDELALSLKNQLKGETKKTMMMMQFFVHLSFIDGELSHSEERIIYKIASFLHVTPKEIAQLISHFASMHNGGSSTTSLENAYKILNISSEADLKEVKKAYRKLVKKYHPDIMQAKGESEAYIKEATAKVQEINEAYEVIKKKLN
jgi:DnaJ like chaperone protein